MKFYTTVTTLLAGIASAAPAWEAIEDSSEVASSDLHKRLWPASSGMCHGSGQWGKMEDGKHAIRDYCTKHGNGQIPPKGKKGPSEAPGNPYIRDSFSYNSAVTWKIKVQTSPLVSHGNQLTYEECIICLYQAIGYCRGNNEDTRGGEGLIRTYSVGIDPDTK